MRLIKYQSAFILVLTSIIIVGCAANAVENDGIDQVSYKVVFDLAGGTWKETVEPVINVSPLQTVSEPPVPIKDSNVFLGWYLEGTDVLYDFSLPVESDLYLVARWSGDSSTEATMLKITFDCNGGIVNGTALNVSEVKFGSIIEAPDEPYKYMAKFKGWQIKGTSEFFDFSQPVIEDLYLIAIWNTAYSLTFDSSLPADYEDLGFELENMPLAPQQVEAGESAEIPEDPEAAYKGLRMIFDGWVDNYGNPYDFTEEMSISERIYASWRCEVRNESELLLWNEITQYVDFVDCKLLSDISMTPSEGSNWNPIKGKDLSYGYICNFDGNGFSISNMMIDSSEEYCGMFSYLKGPSEICDLELLNCIITGKSLVGGIAGMISDGVLISGCIVKGEICEEEISSSGSIGYLDSVGGIVGNSSSSIISDCHFDGSIIASSGSAGGITGTDLGGTITECSSSGKITGKSLVGGMCGDGLGSDFSECRSSVEIKGTSEIGGICGTMLDTEISGCFYSGKIYGNEFSCAKSENRTFSSLTFTSFIPVPRDWRISMKSFLI